MTIAADSLIGILASIVVGSLLAAAVAVALVVATLTFGSGLQPLV
jgi:hypothetical protein